MANLLRIVANIAWILSWTIKRCNVYKITQCFIMLSTGKQEKILHNKNTDLSHSFFSKKVPEEQKIKNFSWPNYHFYYCFLISNIQFAVRSDSDNKDRVLTRAGSIRNKTDTIRIAIRTKQYAIRIDDTIQR